MKKFLGLTVCLIVAFFSNAQKPFEGKITYTVDVTGEGSEMMGAFMFNSYEYYFAENKVRLTMGGGMSFMFGTFIVNEELKTSYMLMEEEEVAYDMSTIEEDEESTEGTNPPKIEKLNETESILGYRCDKYKMTVIEDATTTVTYYWVTEELIPKSSKKIGTTSSLYIDGISGFPLKIVTEFDGLVMTQVATEISKKKPESSLFEIPAGYVIKDFSESPIADFGE